MVSKNKPTSGSRLKECMKLRKKKNKDMCTWLQLKGSNINTDYLSQLRGDKRPISYDNALLFAKYLNIDEGYLMGKDKFVASTYSEYLSIMDKKEQVDEWSPEIQLKAMILWMAGYEAKFDFDEPSTFGDDNYPFTMTVSDGRKTTTIPYDTIDTIQQQIVQYATTLVDAAVALEMNKGR